MSGNVSRRFGARAGRGSGCRAAAPQGGAVLPLFDASRERGLAIDAETARGGWQGETMDYGLAAEGIYYADHPDQRPSYVGGPSSA